MAIPADFEQSTVSERPPRFVLRNTADIDLVLHHLVTHWRPPHLEVRIDRLSILDSARAQHYFRLYSENCNCVLGEMSGGLTFLGGGYHAWISARGDWPNLIPVAVATVCVALLGKGLEVAWTRVRLILVLRDLRRRLVDAIKGRVVDSPLRGADDRHGRPATGSKPGGAQSRRTPRVRSSDIPRPRIFLGDVRDVDRLILHLSTHWTRPRMQIQASALSALTTERAQSRLGRLSAGYSYLPAAALAVLSFLGGFAFMVWPSDEVVLWAMHQDWRDILRVFAVTVCAALVGIAAEVLWNRLQLLWVLLGLRRRLQND